MTRKPEPAADIPTPLAWLEALEARVHDAVARLTELTAENTHLRQRLADLESQLAAAAPGTTDPDQATWHRERNEIRTRVHHLTQTLSTLLEDPE